MMKMILRNLTAVLLSLTFLWTGYFVNLSPGVAQVEAAAAKNKVKPQPTPAKKQGSVMMWEVSPNDGKSAKKIYILGSIHVGSKSTYPLDKKIEDSYKKSDILVVEAGVTELDPVKVNEYILKYGLYTGADTLKKKLPSKTYDQLVAYLKGNGQTMNAEIEKVRPWLLALQIESQKMLKNGYDSKFGIDAYFEKKAIEKKQVIKELESSEFQLKMLSSFTEAEQAAFLESSLTSQEYNKQAMDQMYKAWKVGDVKSLETMLFPKTMSKEEAAINNKVFYQRNVGMVNKIEQYLKDKKNYFVIAGAGHMVGKKGIIELLKAKGYRVKQM